MTFNTDTKTINYILLGALIVLAVLFMGFVYGHSTKSGEALEKQREKESAEFSMESIKNLASNWDPEELRRRAHPFLLDGIKKSGTNMDDYFQMLKKLGAMKDGSKCNFLSLARVITPSEHFVLADYGCNINFENSKALIAIEVRQDNMTGPWKILNFKIDSPLFAKKEESHKAPQEKGK